MLYCQIWMFQTMPLSWNISSRSGVYLYLGYYFQSMNKYIALVKVMPYVKMHIASITQKQNRYLNIIKEDVQPIRYTSSLWPMGTATGLLAGSPIYQNP